MRTKMLVWRLLVLALLTAGLLTSVFAQEESSETSSTDKSDILANLKFRNLGPAVGGGRVTSVVGVPGQPLVYYAGAAAGGVFKTIDGGMSWKAIFEKEAAASIGAIAIAPSNPNLIWVGTGEANPRNDMVTGHGVWFSPDAGSTWKFMGLADAGQISNVIVNPTNPDIVYVGAVGHVWGPNTERGVFKTSDGGKTWQKVLYVNDKTGTSDLIMVPGNPMVLFAGMWEMQRHPWYFDDGGPDGGVFRSTDGGATWKKLTEGLPKGSTGRIGLAAAPSNPHHIYAEVEAKKGILWDSMDLGDHWREVTNNHIPNARPFYFSRLTVSPDNENHIYFLSFDIVESLDGGKTAKVIGRGVHPDNHTIWIDPENPSRIIEGNDGGVYISADAGKSWRYLDNIPIEQFYMVATDDEMPYLLCGGLQDNNGWCGPSNSLSRGGIGGGDWWTATGGDGEYIVPAGHKSNLIYADSQNGSIQRLNAANGLSAYIRPYLSTVSEMAPADLKYRFNWTSPIAVSASDPKEVYLGGSALFKSTDAGAHWKPISGDLTRNDKSKQASSGGSIELDISGAETFDTILSISVSPIDSKTIWVGTDDGLVQMTRDGGEHWSNVTPKGVPEWGRIQQIEAAPSSTDTAYVAIDLHEIDNNKPYVFKTHDGGKTWTSISKGLPDTDPARVIRENPNKKGMLVLGTDTGLFYSMNDGEEWKPMRSNFPTAPIYDLKFHKSGHDLLVATHGRGLFVLDNITPLEETTPTALASNFSLFPTIPAARWHSWNKRGFESGGFVAPNPPTGAAIDYFLKSEIEITPEMRRKRQSPVKIVITDANGQKIKTMYGPAKAGYNRAIWNLQYDGATRLAFVPEPRPNEFFDFSGGPPVVPGTYNVAVTVNGETKTEKVEVTGDPRFNVPMDVFRAQTTAALQARELLSALNEALNRADSLRSQVATVQKLLSSEDEGNTMLVAYKPVLEQARTLDKKVKAFQEGVYNTEAQPESQDRLHYLAKLHDRLQGLMRAASGSYDEPPSELVMEEMAGIRRELQTKLAEFNDLLKNDVVAFNKAALEKGANTLFAGTPIELKESSPGAVGGGQD